MALSYIPKIEYGSPTTTITFEYPNKKDPFGRDITHVGKVLEAKDGTQQILTDYIAETFEVTFSFLSDTLKDQLETFLVTHALPGKSFTYYTDKDDVLTAKTFEIDFRKRTVDFKVITRKGTGFLWEISLKFRRVLA